MIRIFLAHASEDKEAVTHLYQRLKERGFEPWLDKVDLLPGQNWRAEIPKAIKNCDIFLACLSQQSVSKKGYVQKEFKIALNKYAEMPPETVYLIPLRLDKCDIPDLRQDEYGVNLRDIHWVDYFETDGFKQLVKSIEIHFPETKQKTLHLDNSVTLELVYVSDGTFLMGSLEDEGFDNERPQHIVTVPEFWMGKYPVTQEQYRAVTGINPSEFKDKNMPVDCVSWHDAVAFCDRVSQQSGETIRLPSESEWEYACRAGTTTRYYFGDNLTKQQACYARDLLKGREPVGRYPANNFGLHDMHGTVWEWCQDIRHKSYDGAPTDGSAWMTHGDTSYRLLRGGCWGNSPQDCRSASRVSYPPNTCYDYIGFRVVSVLPGSLH